jgi:glycosyltransferase involved in cell wall biosynthesis
MVPAVSINLCCFNSEKYLRETLESIVHQSFIDWELIVINDGSKDSTEKIVNEYLEKGYPIRYYFQENKGLGYSRNKALEHSSGKYIAFIDHDDLWLPRKLEMQVNLLEKNRKIDFVYSNYFKMTNYGRKRLSLGFKKKQPEGWIFKYLIYHYLVFISSVVLTTKSIRSLPRLFDARFQQIEEMDLFLRLLYMHQAAYIDEALAIYRIHDNMTTIRHPELVPQENQYLISKFIEMDPEFSNRFPEIIKYLDIQIIKYNKAKIELLQGHVLLARQLVAPHKWYSFRLFLAYFASFFPPFISVILNKFILIIKRIY